MSELSRVLQMIDSTTGFYIIMQEMSRKRLRSAAAPPVLQSTARCAGPTTRPSPTSARPPVSVWVWTVRASVPVPVTVSVSRSSNPYVALMVRLTPTLARRDVLGPVWLVRESVHAVMVELDSIKI